MDTCMPADLETISAISAAMSFLRLAPAKRYSTLNVPDEGGNAIGDGMEEASDGSAEETEPETEPEDVPTTPGNAIGAECKTGDEEAAGETVDNDEPEQAMTTGECS